MHSAPVHPGNPGVEARREPALSFINWSGHLTACSFPLPMPLQTIEPRRLYRQIADQLRALIDGGEFAAGARLPPERDLAAQLGVSRPSVREALIALEVEGLRRGAHGLGHLRARRRAGRARRAAVHAAEGPLEIDPRAPADRERTGRLRRAAHERRRRSPACARPSRLMEQEVGRRPHADRGRPAVPHAHRRGLRQLGAAARRQRAVRRAQQPAVRAARQPLRDGAQLGRRDRRAPRGGRRDRPPVAAGRTRGDARATWRNSHDRFAAGWHAETEAPASRQPARKAAR